MVTLTSHNVPVSMEKRPSYKVEDDRYRAFWEGLVFIAGIPSGEASVQHFLRKVKTRGIEEATSVLRGTFFMALEDKKSGDTYAFVDNSGLYHAYYADYVVSTSFLRLCEDLRLTSDDLDPEATVEFLCLGGILSDRTFFRGIRKIPHNKILRLSKQPRSMRLAHKRIPRLQDPCETDLSAFYEYFFQLSRSLGNRKVSVDLTGGVDSRIIALMLKANGLEFEAAISGGADDFEDIVLSERVARAIGIPWFRTLQSIEALEEELWGCFSATEGLCDVLYYHRLLQLQNDRRARGMDTVISGEGGELFKDYWWLQDFPFYLRRAPSIGRLVDMRILTRKPAEAVLQEEFKGALKSLRSRMINGLTRYQSGSNTKSYDSIFFNSIAREMGGQILTSHSSYVGCLAPYLDLDMARLGFHLPRRERFFNLVQRRILTETNPRIAALPTSEGGMSASAAVVRMLGDVPRYAANRIVRLLVKLGAKREPPSCRNHPQLMSAARRLRISEEALASLQEAGVIRTGVRLEHIGDCSLGNVLSLGMLSGHLDGRCFTQRG